VRKHSARPSARESLSPLPKLGTMGQKVGELGRKLLAILVLVIAAYVLFKVVLGLVAAVAWIIVVVIAVAAVVWAVGVLR
jgi:hypothetical protein